MKQEPKAPSNGHFDAQAALAALRRAGQQARRVALETGTAVVVRDGGKLVRLSAEQLKAEVALEPRAS